MVYKNNISNDELTEIIKNVVTEVVKVEKNKLTDINLTLAKKLMEKIEQKALHMGVNAVIAITDKGANPITIHCMDNSYIASFDIARNKAYTAAALKISTMELKVLSQPNQPLYGIQFTNDGKIVIFGGGEPLIYQDTVIGGLGISGGTEEQDAELAKYGADLLKEVATWQ